MADVREMRIFSAEQIVVPEELPQILKDFSKEVIRNNPNDIVRFSREYFTRKAAENKIKPKKWVTMTRQKFWRTISNEEPALTPLFSNAKAVTNCINVLTALDIPRNS